MGSEIKICTCKGERLPRFLYKAIHSGCTGNGLNARAINVAQLDDIGFQIYLETNIEWANDNPSPSVPFPLLVLLVLKIQFSFYLYSPLS
jgi:hypothetical protein